MKQDYFTKNKHKLLPWVDNFSNSQDHIRHSNNIRAMSWNAWFYCHPSAYKLCYFGFDIQGMLICTLIAVYFLIRGSLPVGIILLILDLIFLISLIRKIKNRKLIKDLTFYDLYMREYLTKEKS